MDSMRTAKVIVAYEDTVTKKVHVEAVEVVTDVYFSKPMRLLHIIFLSH